MATVDLTVRGAGIFGLSIAWAAAKRGASVRVIDPNGVGAGASGGVLGALAPHTPERWNAKKQFQFESLLMAEGFWAEVDAVSGQSSGYGRIGRIQPVIDDKGLALARARANQAVALWQGQAHWRVVTDPGPLVTASPTGAWVHDTLSARLHPKRACESLAAAIRARGGEIAPQAAEAGPVVHASGVAGLGLLAAQLGLAVGGGVKGQAAVLGLDAGAAPQVFAEALHVVPHADGTIAVGSTSEREFDDPSSTDAQLDALVAKARALVPALSDAPVLQRWAGVRPRAKSRAPMLGPWPGRPGHFVANGGFKIGFGMAPKVAEVMADLVLDGRDHVPDGFHVEDNL